MQSPYLPQAFQFSPGFETLKETTASSFPPLVPPPTVFSVMPGQSEFGMPPFMPEHTGHLSSGNESQEVVALRSQNNLLKREIKEKDKLFDDVISSYAGSKGKGGEEKELIRELNMQVKTLRAKNEQAEQEITRLTKTVRIAEVEVQGGQQPGDKLSEEFKNKLREAEDK